MKRFSFIAIAGMLVSSHAFAQPVLIDLNAKPRAFSAADYDALLACSLEKHPDTTKRYAAYHLQRRDKQTVEQNVADPDSNLMMPSMEGCIEFKNGEQIPFSLDRLIGDWGRAHGIVAAAPTGPRATSAPMTDSELATCMWTRAPKHAQTAVESNDTMKFFMAIVKGAEACGYRNGTLKIDSIRTALRATQPTSAKD